MTEKDAIKLPDGKQPAVWNFVSFRCPCASDYFPSVVGKTDAELPAGYLSAGRLSEFHPGTRTYIPASGKWHTPAPSWDVHEIVRANTCHMEQYRIVRISASDVINVVDEKKAVEIAREAIAAVQRRYNARAHNPQSSTPSSGAHSDAPDAAQPRTPPSLAAVSSDPTITAIS